MDDILRGVAKTLLLGKTLQKAGNDSLSINARHSYQHYVHISAHSQRKTQPELRCQTNLELSTVNNSREKKLLRQIGQ